MPNDNPENLSKGEPVTKNWRTINELLEMGRKLQSEVNVLKSAVTDLRRKLDLPKADLDARWG
jgi:hypothetical protein